MENIISKSSKINLHTIRQKLYEIENKEIEEVFDSYKI